VDTDVRGPAPCIGEHNREVYAGIGIDASELAALAAEGIA
jgi:crotonobetainyl-CoA:carnitine CoA-transferase CaiB-like acyl-CoA transferase